jgi:hypothetical protein
MLLLHIQKTTAHSNSSAVNVHVAHLLLGWGERHAGWQRVRFDLSASVGWYGWGSLLPGAAMCA